MFIQTEPTPNPATLKFIPGKTVLDDGTVDFRAKSEAAGSPLAHRLFDVDGVTGVFLGLRLHLRDQGRGASGSTSSRPSSAPSWSTTCPGAPVVDSGENDRPGRAVRATTMPRTRTRSRPSRSCWTRACARRLPTMAATSSSTASRMASCSCTCAAPAPAVRVRRRRCATASRTCSSTSAPTCRRCGPSSD